MPFVQRPVAVVAVTAVQQLFAERRRLLPAVQPPLPRQLVVVAVLAVVFDEEPLVVVVVVVPLVRLVAVAVDEVVLAVVAAAAEVVPVAIEVAMVNNSCERNSFTSKQLHESSNGNKCRRYLLSFLFLLLLVGFAF